MMKLTNHFFEYLLLTLLVFLFLALALQRALADDTSFSWHVDCVITDPDSGQHHVLIGYTAGADFTGGQLEFTGNGPGFSFDSFEPGEHDRVIDVLTDYGPVWLREDTSMAEITITSETSGMDCSEGTGLPGGQLYYDDRGVINDPSQNSRANDCYNAGVVCDTPDAWILGYYRIREAYSQMG